LGLGWAGSGPGTCRLLAVPRRSDGFQTGCGPVHLAHGKPVGLVHGFRTRSTVDRVHSSFSPLSPWCTRCTTQPPLLLPSAISHGDMLTGDEAAILALLQLPSDVLRLHGLAGAQGYSSAHPRRAREPERLGTPQTWWRPVRGSVGAADMNNAPQGSSFLLLPRASCLPTMQCNLSSFSYPYESGVPRMRPRHGEL
jgi:hypothetical protein